MNTPRPLELLAPARDAEVGRIAVLAGADAVYIGAPAFGARAAATNSIDDIAVLVEFAHRFRARVYVTMNTIVYEHEIAAVEKLVWQLYNIGADALIVQDMAYLGMKLPPIALHASTQCDARTPAKVCALAQAGFSQVVLPREFSLDEIRETYSVAKIPLEVFIHGALCVSYSGDCQAGFVATGRSANRGECPQMCRLPYEIVDAEGKTVAPKRHYLSLRDLNRSADMEALVAAGAQSFKIEGRLKDARYVANVTAAYSAILDRIVAESHGLYSRSSVGKSICTFHPALDRTFNRGYTSYFFGKPAAMASLDTPKWAGRRIGTVTKPYDPQRRFFEIKSTETLVNGDGLGYFDADRRFVGFRLNKAEGDRLYPAVPLKGPAAGTPIYRNSDKAFFDLLDTPDAGCSRTIDVDFILEPVGTTAFALTATDPRGCRTTYVAEARLAEAKTDQTERRATVLGKLGGTIYTIRRIDDRLGNFFVPASVLTEARRRCIALLDTNAADTYLYDRRHPSTLPDNAFADLPPLTYHDNIANSLAHDFYTAHGARIAQPAIEVSMPGKDKDLTVMTTRYCIRRELGACLKEKDRSAQLPREIYLRDDSGRRYRIDCDCARCGMKIVRPANES